MFIAHAKTPRVQSALPDLEVCCNWSRFFSARISGVCGEGMRDEPLRTSAGKATCAPARDRGFTARQTENRSSQSGIFSGISCSGRFTRVNSVPVFCLTPGSLCKIFSVTGISRNYLCLIVTIA